MKSSIIAVVLSLFIVGACSVTQKQVHYPFAHNGHAHNDYEHERPLFDALQYGFRSIEVDVHAWENQLIVAHDSTDFRKLPNIMDLYINPLDSLLKHDLIGEQFLPLILMVDLKTNKDASLKILNDLIRSRRDLFYSSQNNSGPIQILISGDPPLEEFQKLENPYLFLDGRFNQTYPEAIQNQVSRISGRYLSLFGHVHGDDRTELIKEHLAQAHANHQKVRFWGTKDHPNTWQYLMDLNVDWIGTDDLKGFYEWNQSNQK